MSILNAGASGAVPTGAAPAELMSLWDELITGLTMGVVLTDERGQVLATNDVAAELMQLEKSDLLTGARPVNWQIRDDTGAPMPDWAELATQVMRSGSPLSTPLVMGCCGRPMSRLWADYHPVRAHRQSRVLILLQAVDTDVAHSRGLLDPLTGLPGRALMLDRLEQALVRARVRGTLATLALVDVRRLADSNQAYGFAAGDTLLCVLAGRLRQGMSDEHTVARYSGDEFAIVAEHPTATGEHIAEEARHVAGWPVRVGSQRIRPDLRVSWVTSDGRASVHSVVNRAEIQLQR